MQIDIPGNGVMLAVPLKSVAGARTLAYLTDNREMGGKPSMEFAHELIVVILNEGYSDFVMDARARRSGRRRVLHAKGTGRSRAESFFGVSLADEKDVVYIVAYADQKADIMRAPFRSRPGRGTKAGAICFAADLSRCGSARTRNGIRNRVPRRGA